MCKKINRVKSVGVAVGTYKNKMCADRYFCALLFGVVFSCIFLLTGCGVPDKALVLSESDAADNVASDSLDEDRDMMEETDAEPTENADEQKIFVYVCGAVVNPGVVELPPDSRALDALEAVGGLLENAQPDYVNLADRLEDAQKLYFPTREEAEVLIQEEAAVTGGLVNINTAGIEQLCTLSGIGEARAEEIIAYREKQGAFQTEEDIMNVPGIKQGAYEKLKDQITVK